MRRLAPAWIATVLLLGGCFAPDLGATPFACGDGTPACPDGYRCASRLCVKEGAPAPPDASVDAPQISCTAGTKQCMGDLLVDCVNAQSPDITDCKAGCDPVSKSCVVLLASNVPQACAPPTQQPPSLIITGETRWDTDACAALGGTPVGQGPDAPELCVVRFTDFTVPQGATLIVRGKRAPVIIALGRMALGGSIDVSARGLLPGPGASPAMVPPRGGSAGPNTPEGGGGGGHGLPGGRGGATEDSDFTHPGGAAVGNAALAPLTAGGFGGAGGYPCALPPCPLRDSGGAGGGGLQLVACRELLVGQNAVIDASGAGGQGGAAETIASPAGGGDGAGAGGGILIEAPVVSIPAGAVLVANGGGGGGGGGPQGSTGTAGKTGEAGLLAERPALGGAGGGGSAGEGGRGGAQGAPDDGKKGSTGGGGGGAPGRIRINTRSDRPAVVAGSAIISPVQTTGSVGRSP